MVGGIALQWTPGSDVAERYLSVGTSPGSSNVYAGYQGAALARTVTLPTEGSALYVRLSSWISGGWDSVEYFYTVAASTFLVPATMLSPVPGSALSGSTVTFNWTGGSGVTERYLAIGTTPGSSDVYAGYQGASLSRSVSGLPTGGGTIHVRLSSWIGGAWNTQEYSYTSALGQPFPSTITSPTAGSTFTSTTVDFTWTAGNFVGERFLAVGITPGGSEIYGAYQGAALSRTVSGLPANGATVYVRLLSWVAGGWQQQEATYTASGSASVAVKAAVTAPAAGSILDSPAATFVFNTGQFVSERYLIVGTTVGGSQLYSAFLGNATSAVVTGIPADGTPVHVRLHSWIAGGWQYNDYTFGTDPAEVNVALASRGAIAGASSTLNSLYPAGAVNNGDRKGTGFAQGGTWSDATPGVFPDSVTIQFPALRMIDRVAVFSVQDNSSSPVEPGDLLTFGNAGVTDFNVEALASTLNAASMRLPSSTDA